MGDGRGSLAHRVVRGASTRAGELLARVALRDVDRLGPRAHVVGNPWIENGGRIEIGADFRVFSRPVQSHIVASRGASVVIGDRVSLGPGVAMAAEEGIVLGDDVQLGAHVMILDTDYHGVDRFEDRSTTAAVAVEAGARIGARAVLLKGARVGRGARIAAGSVVSGTIPAGAFAEGVPALVRRERGAAAKGLALGALGEDELAERFRVSVAETLGVAGPLEDAAELSMLSDSLGLLRLAIALEAEFGVLLVDDALGLARTVGDLRALVVARVR